MTVNGPWTRMDETPFRSTYGSFRLRAYEFGDGAEHSALIAGRPGHTSPALLRIQSSCLTGTAFGAVLCDCRPQLEESLRRIAAEGSGCVLYMAQEGRGYGLVEKVRQLALINRGLATTANAAGEGLRPDLRIYDPALVMLRDLLEGERTVRLLTNNPTKIAALEAGGYAVQRVALETAPTDDNREYLRVKKYEMGHLLTVV